MATTADAVVVGGGVVGCSIAFHLARLGQHNVLLLEKSTLGAGASDRSGALVRTHYSNEPEARVALAGLRWFEGWDDLVGGRCGFHRTGFIQMVLPGDRDRLRDNTAMLQRAGVETTLIDAAAIRELQPGIAVSEDEIAAYEPRSGYADPVSTTRTLAEAAQRLGATIRTGATVTAVHTERGRVAGVATNRGAVQAPIVVLANGHWATQLTQPLDIDLPIEPVLVQVAFLRRPSRLRRGPAGHLTVIDRANSFYLRPEGVDGTLAGLSPYRRTLEDPDGYHGDVDAEFVPRLTRQVSQRLPDFAGAGLLRAHCGPLDVTPDHCAVLGAAGPDGLYLAVGMSGGGFKKAPAIGACLAELIVEGRTGTAPIEAFRLSRFKERDLIEGRPYTVPEEFARRWGRLGLLH